MNDLSLPQCPLCKHYRGGEPGKMFCAAFPAGIPREIMLGEAAHQQAYPGDQGFRFEYDPEWVIKQRARSKEASPHYGG